MTTVWMVQYSDEETTNSIVGGAFTTKDKAVAFALKEASEYEFQQEGNNYKAVAKQKVNKQGETFIAIYRYDQDTPHEQWVIKKVTVK